MAARLFIFFFVLLLAWGIWFHRAYMSGFNAELEAGFLTKGQVQEVMTIKPFRSKQFTMGRVTNETAADEARYFSNGRIVFLGNVNYRDRNPDGKTMFHLRTEKALGEIETEKGNKNFFQSQKRIKFADLPGPVRVLVNGTDTVLTEKVTLNFVTGELRTDAAVRLLGPGREMTGKGLQYNINSQEYKMGGPIKGLLDPKQLPDGQVPKGQP